MFLTLSVVLSGLSLCLFISLLLRPAVLRSFPVTDFDSKHLLLRMVWPWVATMKPLCEPFVSWRMRSRLEHQIRLANMDAWTPSDVLALQVVLFIIFSFLFSVIGRMLVVISWGPLIVLTLVLSLVFAAWPRLIIWNKGTQRQQQMVRELPFLLDMTTLCVEAGLNLQGALQRAAQYGPPGPLRSEVLHMLAEVRAGTSRSDALVNLAKRTDLPAVASLVSALKQADLSGSSLGPILRSQSDQRRAEQFLRAEELALKAPVKMLFPMVLCIFPCTFLIIGFPVAMTVIDGAW